MQHYKRYLKTVGVLLGLGVNSMASGADDESLDKIFKGIESSYEFPVGELFEKKYDSELRNIFDGEWWLKASMALATRGRVSRQPVPRR